MNDLIPISDEQAKALQEGFKFGSSSLETARALGGYLRQVLGSVPEDLVGLLGGDWLRLRRAQNMITILEKARQINGQKNITPEPAPLTVALPLLQYAADEDRDELTDLWAKLLAAALDPSKRNDVRRTFVETVRQMEPIDALIFRALFTNPGPYIPSQKKAFSTLFEAGEFDVEVGQLHLCELKCAYNRDGANVGMITVSNISPTSFGQSLYNLLSN